NLTTLSLSFWDYALESAARILNMVPTKMVDKTPYELWYGKVPNLSYLKVWGCEALVKQDTPKKLQQRSVKCIFIGYLKEIIGYYFYFPPKNKIVVARYVEFFEKNLLSQEVTGRAGEHEEIQDEDTSYSENTSEIPMEFEGFEPPHEEEAHVRRSVRTHRAPKRLCLNVEVEEHSLGDLNEPANYKAAMLDPESDKWLDAMNAEMQSMKDNQVWRLVDLPPNCKTIGGKWIFKKKTDMDGIVRTYKARFVAKGFTQIFRIDYKETFSPVADIRAIRILIAIAASKRVIGLSQSAYMDKILKRFKMDKSKRGNIPMQKRFDLNKTQGASKLGEVKCMQNVPYASDVGEPHWTAVKTIIKIRHCFERNHSGLEKLQNKVLLQCLLHKQNNIAASEAEMEVVWIRKFISKLGIVPTINEPIKMYCDNSAVFHFANEQGVQKGTRHYLRRYHYVRECIQLVEIKLLKVHTYDNLADPFTKALPKEKLTQHARSIGLRLASSFM
ncbi:retrotransposon protein, putative, ty1-copia subclass, partial [Tanacetum coccineum]